MCEAVDPSKKTAAAPGLWIFSPRLARSLRPGIYFSLCTSLSARACGGRSGSGRWSLDGSFGGRGPLSSRPFKNADSRPSARCTFSPLQSEQSFFLECLCNFPERRLLCLLQRNRRSGSRQCSVVCDLFWSVRMRKNKTGRQRWGVAALVLHPLPAGSLASEVFCPLSLRLC